MAGKGGLKCSSSASRSHGSLPGRESQAAVWARDWAVRDTLLQISAPKPWASLGFGSLEEGLLLAVTSRGRVKYPLQALAGRRCMVIALLQQEDCVCKILLCSRHPHIVTLAMFGQVPRRT